jgi:hypothetical protein
LTSESDSALIRSAKKISNFIGGKKEGAPFLKAYERSPNVKGFYLAEIPIIAEGTKCDGGLYKFY